MNANQFVAALVAHVHETAISSVVQQLEAPSGRKPSARNIELTSWYGQLSERDRSNLVSVIGQSVHAALFGALCVVDGVRLIQDGTAPYELQLVFQEQDSTTRLNEPDAEALHDIYQGLVSERVFG